MYVHVFFFVSWFSASHGQPNWSSKFHSFLQYLEDLDIMLKHVDTYLRDFNIMLNHTWEAASMFESAMPPGSSWSGEDCQHRSWKLYALRCQWQVLYASYTGVAPGPPKNNNGIPTLRLQTVYSHNPTQCLQVMLSKCAVSILHVCCLFMFVLSWVTIYIYICICVCVCVWDVAIYGPMWLNMAQFWHSHGSTSTWLMHFITLLWAPRVRRWLNQDPNELFKLSNHALSKFRVRLFRQVSAAAWALMATCCWFCFFSAWFF